MAFYKYTGVETAANPITYPSLDVTVYSGRIVDFGNYAPPSDGKWVSDPGPANAGVASPVPSATRSVSLSGAAAGRPAAGVFGEGFRLSTDTSSLDYSNGTAWTTGLATQLPVVPVRRITGATVVTALQAGHTWTVTNTAVNVNLNNTTDFVLGSQSVTFNTDGLGGVSIPQSPNPISPTINLTGKAFRIWIKVDDPTKINEFTFWACSGASFANTYSWDVVKYNGAVPNYILPGQWSPVTLHLGTATITGTPDKTVLNRMKFQVRDKAGGAIAVGMNGVEVISDASATYPNGVVSISFDDCYASQYLLAKALMDKYSYQGTAYVITGAMDTAGRLTTAQAQTMQSVGWDIAAHAATQANHDAGFQNLATADLLNEARTAKGWLLSNGFRAADHMAYPGGHYESGVSAAIAPYFVSARSIFDQNAETWPPADPQRIRAQQPSSSTPLANLEANVDQVFTGKGWLPISFHDIVASGATGVQYTSANFDALLAYIQAKGCAVRTVTQVLRGE